MGAVSEQRISLGQQHPTEGAAIGLRSRDLAHIWEGGSDVPHGDCQAADIAHIELQETKELPWGSQALQKLPGGSLGYRNTSVCQELSCRALVGALNPTGTVTPQGSPG